MLSKFWKISSFFDMSANLKIPQGKPQFLFKYGFCLFLCIFDKRLGISCAENFIKFEVIF